MAFPTLSKAPTSFSEEKEDTTIKSKSEAGYVQTRRRFTRERMTFKVGYELLPNADKVSLFNHIDSVFGGVSTFTYVHPVSGVTYTVRYNKRPEAPVSHYDGTEYLWSTSFVLNEV